MSQLGFVSQLRARVSYNYSFKVESALTKAALLKPYSSAGEVRDFNAEMEQQPKAEKPKTEPCEQPSSTAAEASTSAEVPRGSANRKERKRTLTMNSAFAELRDHIPNVPPDTKLSKIKTLRLAISYIKFLMEILEESNDGKPGRSHRNFVADLTFQNEGREKRKRESIVSIIHIMMLVIDRYRLLCATLQCKELGAPQCSQVDFERCMFFTP